jgi:hypothetical protein
LRARSGRNAGSQSCAKLTIFGTVSARGLMPVSVRLWLFSNCLVCTRVGPVRGISTGGLPVPWIAVYVPEAERLRAELISLEDQPEQLQDGTQEFERLCCLRNRLWRQEELCKAQAWMLLFPGLEALYHRHPTVP